MADQFYDVIVIGGGSAGCAAAARLSEDSTRRVLLLEAGPDPTPLPSIVADGMRGNAAVLESPFVVMYPTERKSDGSTYYPLSGRVLGGGSSVNMMGWVHPTQHDLDTWAQLGNSGWSYEDCLPILKRIEADEDFGDRPHHGTEGPVYVKRRTPLDSIQEDSLRAVMDRAHALGLPMNDDSNVPNPEGIVPGAANVKDGLRQSMAVAYIDPARSRHNLTIQADALVHRLLLEGTRVIGVEYEYAGQMVTASADLFVLSSGVYHSPQILMLSGIGPESDLNELGIRVAHDLPGVGQNYQDHANVTLTYEGAEGFNPDWLVGGFRMTYKSNPSLVNADFHIFLRAPINVEGLRPMMPITANLIEQRSRGRVRLASTNAHDLPVIDDGLLQHPDDLAAMLRAMHFIDELVDHESMKAYFGSIMQPALSEDWEEFALTTYDCYHHGVGTCMMGTSADPMAVVDGKLRVRGIDNLYVADASIMPTVTHANTNMTSIMIGERVSDFVRESGG